MAAEQSSTRYPWKFFRSGGFDQVKLDKGADLLALERLDQKLWVALACPTRGLEFDARTLDLIDVDHDGRIRAPEILSAVKWACSMVKNPDVLIRPGKALPLSAINDATPDGKQLVASAKQILRDLGRADADAISVEDTTDTVRIFSQTKLNGDGVILPESSDDPAVQEVTRQIIATLGGETDRSGKTGITQAKVDQFFAELAAFEAWSAKTEKDAATLLPLGDKTAAAAAAVRAVKAKVDDFFARCRLAAFDARAVSAMNRQESELHSIALKDLSAGLDEITALPLARVEPGKALPLDGSVNPAWSDAVARLLSDAVTPLLGAQATLTESQWRDLVGKVAPYEAWQKSKAGGIVESLGIPRVREILASNHKDTLTELVKQDRALEPEANAIANVDKLARYYRDLALLLNNFVNFRDFYCARDKAIFQAGTLFLDQRSCDLCVRVEDMGRHGAMAHLSRAYLVYCDLNRKATGEKMSIVAAFTGGDSDNLMVGRNGIFYDRQGRDWDATIAKIVENPISVRQAFWAPYKRVIRWIEDQVAKRAAAADAASTDKLTTAAAATGDAAAGKPPAAKPKIDIGMVAALGVAVGGITAALGMLLQAFFGLGIWMPLGFVALILVISGPSMIIAWLKLRQRNIGPILDANGWAVNASARINIPFGGSLTKVAKLPPGSSRDLTDPYAEKSPMGKIVITVVILIALWASWNYGAIERIVPGVLPKSSWLKLKETPPPVPAPSAGATVEAPPAAAAE